MKLTCKKFMTFAAAFAALGWYGAFSAPARKQRDYLDMTWWDPHVENITDTDTYLRRKFRQDVTDKATGLSQEALGKRLASIVAEGKAAFQTTDIQYNNDLIGKLYKIDLTVEPKADPGNMKSKLRYPAGNWSDYSLKQ